MPEDREFLEYRRVVEVRFADIDRRFSEVDRRFRDDIATPLREIATRFEQAQRGTQTTGRWLIGLIVGVVLIASGAVISQVRQIEQINSREGFLADANKFQTQEIVDLNKRISLLEQKIAASSANP